MTDYRALMAEWLSLSGEPTPFDDEAADTFLATKVPDLCPDCEGTCRWECNDPECNSHSCSHPNAPTIARLLAIGEAVWTARKEEQ